jgi:hypothetical protein
MEKGKKKKDARNEKPAASGRYNIQQQQGIHKFWLFMF